MVGASSSDSERELHVVVDGKMPVYASDSLEKCQTVLEKLNACDNPSARLWQGVSHSLRTASSREAHR